MFKVNNKNTKTTSFEQVNPSCVCQFVTFLQFVSKILVWKVLSWLLWSGFTLYWICCKLPTDIHLLKPNPIISKQKSSDLCSDVIKTIQTTEVVTNIVASCLWCFALFGDISGFRFSGSYWSTINAGWAWIDTTDYSYCYLLMFLQ